MKPTHVLNSIAHRFGLHLTRNRVIGFHVGRNSVFNPFVVQKRLVPHCDVIFDAGAYIGDVSRLYSRMYPEATIYAFEPTPAAQEALRQIGPRVVPIASAISSREGTAMLHVNTLPQTNSLHRLAERERRYYPKEAQPAETIEVPLTTIDAFCQSRRLAGPDILKMDIQCHEVEALRGAEATPGGWSVDAAVELSDVLPNPWTYLVAAGLAVVVSLGVIATRQSESASQQDEQRRVA